MAKTVHVVGNGDAAVFFNEAPRKGLKLACNKAPFPIENCYASCMVDFKMMKSIHKGDVDVPGYAAASGSVGHRQQRLDLCRLAEYRPRPGQHLGSRGIQPDESLGRDRHGAHRPGLSWLSPGVCPAYSHQG